MKKAHVDFYGLSATYPNGKKKYAYWTDIEDLSVGEVVVVQSQDTLTLANFKGYIEESETHPTKWIINRVNIDKDKELKEKEANKARLKREMDERFKIFSEVDLYRMVALYDEKMKGLINEYDELMGTKPDTSTEGEVKSAIMKNMWYA